MPKKALDGDRVEYVSCDCGADHAILSTLGEHDLDGVQFVITEPCPRDGCDVTMRDENTSAGPTPTSNL